MKPLKVLVACEFSRVVSDAFQDLGHDVLSCDYLDPLKPGKHYKGNVWDVLKDNYDLMIGHPPCTYLCNSGVSWLYNKDGSRNYERWTNMQFAAIFFKFLLSRDIPHIAIENPIMHKYAKEIIGQNYDQLIQPYYFGHKESKGTCLWLKKLPLLKPTNVVLTKEDVVKNPKEYQKNHWLSPSKDRWKLRSTTYQGIAEAMAKQYSEALN